MTSVLFSPIRLAGLELANRIVVSPMCQYSANDGVASDWHMTHLGSLVNSGAGLVVAEMTDVERRGRISHGCLGLYSDACEAALTRIVDHCHRIGTAKIGVQLAHAGRKGSARRPWEGRGEGGTAPPDPWQTIAPSAIPFGADWAAPRAMTQDDIEEVRDAFAAAARRAVRCGFDAIELHMAHGYLLHEFLSPIANARTDAYGGSFDRRIAFPLEVFDAVRGAWPVARPLGVRLSCTDWVDGGFTLDESIEFARRLVARGCDWIDASSGGVSPAQKIPLGPGYQVPLSRAIRHATGARTMAVGLITTPAQAQEIVASGDADLVAMARGFLWDPRWVWHAAAVLGAPVVPPPQYLRSAPRDAASVFTGAKIGQR
jgi:2,4-dienoyl-CoA reductase-like NADH-dependent reductase (Old Yellow Enzyme family)